MWFTSIQQFPHRLLSPSPPSKIMAAADFCWMLHLRHAVFASCRSLRGTLFIQDSSLLYTLSLKLHPLACLHKFLQRFISFRKQNASGLNIRISTSSRSQKSLDARLRWFVSYVNLSQCAKCLMETDSSVMSDRLWRSKHSTHMTFSAVCENM